MRFGICSLMFSLAVAVGCTESQQATTTDVEVEVAQPVSFNTEGLPVVEIDVPGLHCEHCSATACTLLADIPGVMDVKADPDTKKALIAIDEGDFDSEAARSALEDQFGEATLVDDQAAVETEPAGENS